MLKWILIGILVYLAVKGISRHIIVRSSFRRASGVSGGGKICSEMVKCARCDTYVLKNSARLRDGDWACLSHDR